MDNILTDRSDNVSVAETEFSVVTLVNSIVPSDVQYEPTTGSKTGSSQLIARNERADPIQTPISIPHGLSLASSLPHTANVNPFANAAPSWIPSPYVEEAKLTNEFVLACCRLHEAGNVVTTLCNHFIYQWSGVQPDDAPAIALRAIENGIGNSSWYFGDGQTEHGMCIEAVALQLMLSLVQLECVMVGAEAGVVMDARSTAEAATLHRAKDKFLPLPLMQQGQSTTTADTFSQFSNGVTFHTDTSHFKRTVKALVRPAERFREQDWYFRLRWKSVSMAIYTIKTNAEYTMRDTKKDIFLGRLLQDPGTIKGSDILGHIRSATRELEHAMECVDQLHQEILAIVRLKNKVPRKHWFSIQPRKKQDVSSDEMLVLEAGPACEQAKLAVQATYNNVRKRDG